MLAAGVFEFRKIASDPKIPLLLSEGGAEWIRYPEPTYLRSRAIKETGVVFRKRFRVDYAPHAAFLYVRAFKDARVMIDGQPILVPYKNLDNWKNIRSVDIGPMIRPGEHEIVIMVMNRDGPPAALAYCGQIGLFTGRDWETSRDGTSWTAGLPVNEIVPPEILGHFRRADEAILSRLPYLGPIFLLVFALSFLFYAKDRPGWIEKIAPGASGVRWFLLLAWCVIGINDAYRVPVYVGFDSDYHFEYIKYVAEKFRIPLPNEGWQMFQSPLYYMISAPFYIVFSKFYDADTVNRILRFIPIICGALQVEFSYRALKTVFPNRGDLHALGTTIGGLIPMNLYSSQVVGNEPLAGMLTAAVTVMGFSLIRSGAPKNRWHLLVMGALLGLALLSKMTAFLLLPPLFLLLVYVLYRGEGPVRRAASGIAGVFVVAFAVSSWYYIRNWIELGRPFIGGWASERKFDWWQDPGYRTVGQFLSFGQCLIRPVYSGIYGVWDAIYSTFWLDGFLSSVVFYEYHPPWNYNFMISGAWLALAPSLGIVAGFLRALRRPAQSAKDGLLFADLFIAVYFAGIVSLYITLPIYSTGKATYTLGLIPCYAVLAASGLDLVMRRPILRAIVYASIACWAVSAYLAFFVL